MASMDTADTVLTSLFFITAFAYIALLYKTPFKGDFLLKSVPVICLAILSAFFVPGIAGTLLCIGFLFSAGGDTSLSFSGEKFFLGGLGSFLIAHVFYSIAFAQNFSLSMESLPWIAVWLVFSIGMLFILLPKLGDMKIPVLVYIAVIFTMLVFATLWQGVHPKFLLFGAVLFALSDAMISIDKFLKPIAWSKYFIMVTYYAGQFLIYRAFIT
jgi:uncharacterized membrane protein YhhN